MSGIGRVRVEQDGQVVVACLQGELDLSNTAAIQSAIVSSVDNEAAGVVVDLSATAYLDSTGLSLLFDLARRLSRRQQALRVVVPTGSPVRRLLDLAGLCEVAAIDERVEVAVAAIREPDENVV